MTYEQEQDDKKVSPHKSTSKDEQFDKKYNKKYKKDDDELMYI